MESLKVGKKSYNLSAEDPKVEQECRSFKAWKKFLLLLWKNWKIQARHPAQTVLETVLPLIFCTILVIVRSLAEVVPYPESRWEPFTINKLPNIPRNDLGIPIPGFLPWPFAYAPNNTAVTEVMNVVAKKLNLRVDNAYGFANEADMVSYIMDTYNSVTGPTTDFLGGVVFTNTFPNSTELPDSLTLKLRLRGKLRYETSFSFVLTWVTELLFDPFGLPGPRNKDDAEGGYPGYYREGFLALQHAISSAIIEKSTGVDPSSIDIEMQRFPYPAYMEDYFVLVLQDWLGIILMLGFIYPVMNNVRNICNEKEARLKARVNEDDGTTQLASLDSLVHEVSVIFLAMIILMTVLQKVPWYGNGISVVNKTDGTVLFFFYFIFSCSTICACFLISTFFKTGSNAALGAGIIWFLLFAPSYFLQYEYRNMTRDSKFGVCLLLNTAMALAMDILSSFESTGAGVQWSTFFTPPSADDNFSFGDATVMVAVDGVICLVLALYIEALFPGEFGVPKKWYFP